MEQLTQQEHDYLYFRLAIDFLNSSQTYNKKELPKKIAYRMMNMTHQEAKKFAADTQEDMKFLYKVYLATVTHE